jgi:hypothetical protein
MLAVVAQPREHSAAVQAFALDEKVELAPAKLIRRGPAAEGLPMAAIPKLDRRHTSSAPRGSAVLLKSRLALYSESFVAMVTACSVVGVREVRRPPI